jgi:hypothetical protein
MHEYWDKQPVPREGTEPGEIDESRDVTKKNNKTSRRTCMVFV